MFFSTRCIASARWHDAPRKKHKFTVPFVTQLMGFIKEVNRLRDVRPGELLEGLSVEAGHVFAWLDAATDLVCDCRHAMCLPRERTMPCNCFE